ncbi:prepilin-type N-terminal cleavage/methylation domain-containing protein [Candidatus Dojkabacteria bacterium]|nr:prepilin-type N-terminal cleavage/methylation domain-containing protein [Candidatus Dojkabacteria bacterium]
MKLTKKAFSLVELLVAMAIIAVLISIAAYGINIVQRNARDTKRRKAVEDIILVMADAQANTMQTPQCFGSSGVRGHISIYMGPISGCCCTGDFVAKFDTKYFRLVGTADNRGKINPVSGTCNPITSRETNPKELSICYDRIHKQLLIELEGSDNGFSMPVP